MSKTKNKLHEIIVAGQSGHILTIIVDFKWFDMIAENFKKKDYRAIKPYWTRRLFNPDGSPKQFDFVRIRKGYTKISAYYNFLGTTIEIPNPHWSPPAFHKTKFYAIELGEMVYSENLYSDIDRQLAEKSIDENQY